MDEENTTSRPDSSRRRLKIAGIATVALLAVPGGAVISNAFAADGGSASTTPAQPTQSQQPAQSFIQNQVFATPPHFARDHSMPSMLIRFGTPFRRSSVQNSAVL